MVTISSWDRPINIYRIILWAKIETRWWGSRHGHSWFAWKTMLGWINLRARGLNYISNHIHTLGAGDRENRVTELIQKHVIARNDRLHERIMWHAFSCNNAFFSSFFPFVSLPSRPRLYGVYLTDWNKNAISSQSGIPRCEGGLMDLRIAKFIRYFLRLF